VVPLVSASLVGPEIAETLDLSTESSSGPAKDFILDLAYWICIAYCYESKNLIPVCCLLGDLCIMIGDDGKLSYTSWLPYARSCLGRGVEVAELWLG